MLVGAILKSSTLEFIFSYNCSSTNKIYWLHLYFPNTYL